MVGPSFPPLPLRSHIGIPSPGDDRQFLALKVLAAGQHKDGITELIRLGTPPSVDANVSDQGRQYICHLVDHFKHTRPDGTKHVCLALELMGEDMDTFCVNFTPEAIPMPLMRRFTAQLVLALGWAHRLGITHAGRQRPLLDIPCIII